MTSATSAVFPLASESRRYEPNRLLDALRQWLNLRSDEELSGKLGISLSIIRGIRAGRIAVAASMLLWMAELAGRSTDDLRRVLGDRRRRARPSCGTLAARGRIEITDAMVEAALQKAIEAGLLARRTTPDERELHRALMLSILRCAVDAEAGMAEHVRSAHET